MHGPMRVNPLNAELNPICHLLALLGGATIVVVSRLRVKFTIVINSHSLCRNVLKIYDAAECLSTVSFYIMEQRNIHIHDGLLLCRF